MNYNEIQNILIDSVVLPNKLLSNLAIIDGAKTLTRYEFRGVFLRDTLPEVRYLQLRGLAFASSPEVHPL